MTPAEPVVHKLKTPVSVCEMDALRARIHSQSKAVADHIAANAEAQAFLDDWVTGSPSAGAEQAEACGGGADDERP